MTDRFRDIDRIFDAALDVAVGRRAAFLDAECPAELRSAVESLLGQVSSIDGTPRSGPDDETILRPPAMARLVGDDPSFGGGDGAGPGRYQPGERIGPYVIEDLVGVGGMGHVLRARDTRRPADAPVALKVMPVQRHFSTEARTRFVKEARAAASLDHPNICRVLDLGSVQSPRAAGLLYFAMELYDGATLDREFEAGPMDIERSIEIAAQTAEGLAHAHRRGVLHRDIKPSNLLVQQGADGRLRVKILDFGLAKGASDTTFTRPGTALGTFGFMSPEQAMGETVDCRTDVWALGVVLYTMLAGRRPFGGEDIDTVLRQVLTHHPPPLRSLRPEVPEVLEAIVERALAKDVERRIHSADGLATALRTGRLPASNPGPGLDGQVVARREILRLEERGRDELLREQLDDAAVTFRRGLDLARGVDDRHGIAVHSEGLARLALALDDVDLAIRHLRDALPIWIDEHDPIGHLAACEIGIDLLLRRGRIDDAARLIGASHGPMLEVGHGLPTADRTRRLDSRDGFLRRIVGTLGPEATELRVGEGLGLGIEALPELLLA